MDVNEQLVALQKEYEDVLLNVSKEAAERVMELINMVARHKYELQVTREEGVCLKEMMDSKINEAEADKKKIEVLEAQLNEAEDIVKDLRDELREARDEIERAKRAQLDRAEINNHEAETEPGNTCTEETSTGNISPLHQSLAVLPEPQSELPAASVVTRPYRKKPGCLCTSCVQNRYLPSILTKRCAKKICVRERKLLHKKPGPSEDSNKSKANKIDAIPEQDEEPASRAKSSTEIAKKQRTGAKVSKSYGWKGKKAVRKGSRIEDDSKPVDFSMDAENGTILLADLERRLDEAVTGHQNEPVKEKNIIKYQRKRRRQALVASNVDVSLQTEQDCVDRQLEEEDVALQLIILSGQK